MVLAGGGCVFSLKHHNPVLYGSWQFSGIVTQGQTAKNRGVVHDSCECREEEAGGGVCARVCGWGQRKRVLSH